MVIEDRPAGEYDSNSEDFLEAPGSKPSSDNNVTEPRVLHPTDRIYDLTEIIEKPGVSDSSTGGVSDAEIMRRVEAVAEKIAREMFPSIAERLIKEEIAKLKDPVNAEVE